jgi:hypothetical protein
MQWHFSRRVSLLFAFLALASHGLLAQGVSADIRGTITDPSGATVKDAVVTITDVTKGWSRKMVTGANGDYQFVQLTPADTFALAVEAAGFRKEVRSGIVFETGQQSRVDLQLLVGSVTDSVMVEGAASLVDTENASVGAVVDERKVEELPLNGRQFWQLSQLVPNVLPPTQNSSIGFRGGFNVSGHQEVENNYILDGVDNADQATMQPTNRPSVDGIQEFKVLTGVYNAEYGRYSGGQILITTKSGSNDFHGTAFEFLRNSDLDARNFFGPHVVPAFRRNQFGGSNGGRIRKDRTFYFVTYEGLRLTNQVTGLATVPTAAMIGGNLAGLGTIKDPTTGKAFPNNLIPSSELNPISQAFAKYFASPTSGALTSNYNYSLLGNEQDNQFSGRIDQVISAKNNLFVSYQFAQRQTLYQANTVCGSRVLPGFGCTEPERDQGLSISETHIFAPTVVNDLRLGYNRIRTNRFNQDASFGDVDQTLGIPQPGPNGQGIVGNLGLPQISVTGYATIGDPTNLPQGRRNNTYNVIDGLSWIKGAHTLKFGGDYKYFIYNYAYLALADARGSFSFNGQYSGNALVDFLLGDPRSTSVSPGDPTVRSYDTSAALYAQDEWKVTQKLTLSLGLRWELTLPQKERLDKWATFDPSTGLDITGTGQLLNVSSTGQLVQVGTSSLSAPWNTRWDNLAPRFGLAYRPFNDTRTVVRAGAGKFYNAEYGGTDAGVSSLFRGIPFRASQTFTNSASSVLATWTNPYPSTTTSIGGYTPYGLAYTIKTPNVEQWTFGVERELAKDLILETTYLGSKGTDLSVSLPFNQPAPAAGAIQARRPYPQWGPISFVEAAGNSTYHSLAVRLERRFAKGLSLLTAYTYGHSIDDVPGSGDGETGILDPHDLAGSKGNSTFDVKHRLATSFVYQLPFGEGGIGAHAVRPVRAVISGWETTGILTLQTGSPFSVVTSKDISNTGAANRPFVVASPALADPTATEWFNTAAFSLVEPAGTYAYGNAGRNILRGDGLKNLDFGLFRHFPISERVGLQFRAETFNIANHTNFGLPVNDASSSSFGQVTLTSTSSRDVQFGLKLLF